MLALLLAAALNTGSCANPSIVSAGVESVAQNGALNRYTIAIVVQNQGGVTQPSDLLESVDVIQAGQKTGQMGLQPLHPGQSQKVIYTFDRSNEAANGTTDLTFSLDFNGRAGDNIDCHGGHESVTISV
ncbi:MAG: hypothetical protein JO219_08785 [Candidatus Eremiobacteraeota bacterium]|nr:hypothetical protein [Candidatus Eremiobacteraeota bacterium]